MSSLEDKLKSVKLLLTKEDLGYWEPIKMVLESAASKGYIIANYDTFPYIIFNEEALPKGVTVTTIATIIFDHIYEKSKHTHQEERKGFSTFKFLKEFDLEKATLNPKEYLAGAYFQRADEFARYGAMHVLDGENQRKALELIAKADAEFEIAPYAELDNMAANLPLFYRVVNFGISKFLDLLKKFDRTNHLNKKDLKFLGKWAESTYDSITTSPLNKSEVISRFEEAADNLPKKYKVTIKQQNSSGDEPYIRLDLFKPSEFAHGHLIIDKNGAWVEVDKNGAWIEVENVRKIRKDFGSYLLSELTGVALVDYSPLRTMLIRNNNVEYSADGIYLSMTRQPAENKKAWDFSLHQRLAPGRFADQLARYKTLRPFLSD